MNIRRTTHIPILTMARDADEHLTPAHAADSPELDHLNKNYIHRQFSELAEWGLLVRVERGKYTITERGREVLSRSDEIGMPDFEERLTA